MLAYWIWQLTPSLLSHLGSLGGNPIVIQFRLENPECWGLSTPLPPVQPDDSRELGLRCSDRRVELSIPGNVVKWLGAADNAGERRIVSRILEGIGELLIYAGVKNTLTLAEIERILDLHVPLGLKKKITVLADDPNVALNPHNVPQFRSLQDFDIGEQQDIINRQMDLGTGGRREIVGREEKNELCKEVAKLSTQLLRENLREFHWKDLLSTFIGLHEAYWHQAAMDGLVIPTRLQCFGDIRSGETSYSEEWMRFGATGTAIRTIIEIVAAEPPSGCRPLSRSSAS